MTTIYRGRFENGVAMEESDLGAHPLVAGETAIAASDSKLHYHDGTTDRTIVDTASAQTISGKTLDNTNTISGVTFSGDDSTFVINDHADPTIQIKFNAAGTAGTSTTITGSQTTNKVVTLPNATDTLVGKATTDSLTNKTLSGSTNSILVDDSNFSILDNGDETKIAKFQASGISAGNTRTYTLPDANDTLVGKATTDIFTNKTLSGSTNTVTIDDNKFTLQDNGDETKQFQVQLSGITAGNTRTWTVPDSSDTFVGKATTDIFTNKTYDAEGSGNSLSNVKDSNIKAAAAIAVNKLAALTASKAVVSDGSGFLASSATTATEIGYVSGATANIQTQINALTQLNRDYKESCTYATTAALTGSYIASPTFTFTETGFGALSIDGGTPSVGDRILVKDNSNSTNGIYTVTTVGTAGSSYVLTRAIDANTSAQLTNGAQVWVNKGTANSTSVWAITTDDTITLDTTTITFSNISGLGLITAGAGTTKTGNTINVVAADTSITVNADSIQVGTGGITNTHINGSAAIDATKIANGVVSSTEFQYLDGVTSAIQTQIDTKATKTNTTDNKLIRADGAAGAIQGSGITVDDSDNVSGMGTLSCGALTVNDSIIFTNSKIFEGTFALSNNQALTNVTGFAFTSARGFTATVSIYVNATSVVAETYLLMGSYNGTAWTMAPARTGDTTGVVLTLTNAGQIQYTSTNASGYVSSVIKWNVTQTST